MTLRIKNLGRQDYQKTWQAMREFTDQRSTNSHDELWLVEHPPVFTLGQAGKPEHILNPGNIPTIKTDRGGQVTYHGPGQIIIYVLIELRRHKLGVRRLVTLLETSIIDLLAEYNIQASSRCDAPGVYVNEQKIASIGLRIRRHCSYHGLALNVDMDLSPFKRINPCGYPGLTVTQLSDLVTPVDTSLVQQQLCKHLQLSLRGNSKSKLQYGKE